MRRVVAVYPDAYVFDDGHGIVLVIVAHGDDQTRSITIDGVPMDAAMLAQRIPTWANLFSLKAVHLAACFTADFGHASLACQLSLLMPGVLVDGHAGTVSTGLWPEYMHHYSVCLAPDTLLNQYFHIFRNEPYSNDHFEHFHRISFRNGTMVDQAYNIVTINGSTFATL